MFVFKLTPVVTKSSKAVPVHVHLKPSETGKALFICVNGVTVFQIEDSGLIGVKDPYGYTMIGVLSIGKDGQPRISFPRTSCK